MKMWKWETFVVSFIVSFGVVLLLFSGFLRIESWTPVVVISLILAAGFTFVKGLLTRISDLEYRASLLEARIRELEKKADK
jgi:divalent metal cation (Fe/Co/Zn/Cd) transporter